MAQSGKIKRLIIEIDEQEWLDLQEKVKNTRDWKHSDYGTEGGSGRFNLTNDPEYPEEVFLVEVKIIDEPT